MSRCAIALPTAKFAWTTRTAGSATGVATGMDSMLPTRRNRGMSGTGAAAVRELAPPPDGEAARGAPRAGGLAGRRTVADRRVRADQAVPVVLARLCAVAAVPVGLGRVARHARVAVPPGLAGHCRRARASPAQGGAVRPQGDRAPVLGPGLRPGPRCCVPPRSCRSTLDPHSVRGRRPDGAFRRTSGGLPIEDRLPGVRGAATSRATLVDGVHDRPPGQSGPAAQARSVGCQCAVLALCGVTNPARAAPRAVEPSRSVRASSYCRSRWRWAIYGMPDPNEWRREMERFLLPSREFRRSLVDAHRPLRMLIETTRSLTDPRGS